MKYNLALHSQLTSNTTIGTESLSTDQLLDILNNQGITTLSGGSILCLDCDLGARIKVDEIRYYFSGPASGIEFYYKDDSADSYSLLDAFVAGSYYYTTVSGESAPRYIRLKHTVTESGIAQGFVVRNNDSVVNFGTDGTRTEENFELAILYVPTDIRAVPIYNSGTTMADAYITIDYQGDLSDSVFYVGPTTDGPWTTPIDNVIADSDTWTNGTLNNLELDDTSLVISSGASGNFVSSVFDTPDYNTFSYIIIDANTTVTGVGNSMIAVDAYDTQTTIEIRSSNNKPRDYETYTRCIDEAPKIVLKEYLLSDDSLIWTSDDLTQEDYHQVEQGWDDTDARIAIDPLTNRKAVLFKWQSQHDYSYDIMNVAVLDPDGNITTLELSNDERTNTDLNAYFLELDSLGGFWFYVYPYNIGNFGSFFFDKENYYYLAYFDKNLNNLCKFSSDTRMLYDASVVYDTGDIWYTDSEVGAIMRLDRNGNVKASLDTLEDTRGIVATPDGGCYYIQENVIYKIDADTILEFLIEPEGVSDASRIELAYEEDFIWITDNRTVKKIDVTSGRVVLSVTLPEQAIELQKMNTGVAVFCTDKIWRFVNNSGDIYKSYDPGGKKTYIKTLSVDYTNEYFSPNFPLATDTSWNTLSWKKIVPEYYNLSQETYHQIRITLRASESLESPALNAVYLQEAVSLEDIYPNSYKNIYVKADISSVHEEDAGSYDTNLKVWWNVPL